MPVVRMAGGRAKNHHLGGENEKNEHEKECAEGQARSISCDCDLSAGCDSRGSGCGCRRDYEYPECTIRGTGGSKGPECPG